MSIVILWFTVGLIVAVWHKHINDIHGYGFGTEDWFMCGLLTLCGFASGIGFTIAVMACRIDGTLKRLF